MRTFTTTHTVYTFDELTEEGKRQAIEKLYDINVDYDWWGHVYEDAEQIGLKITGFDLDRYLHATGHLTEDMQQVCKNIISEHGESCATYRLAIKNQHKHGEDNEEQFAKDLLEEYAHMLQSEYEYLTSEEAIIETIQANEYEFDENGGLV